MLVIVRNVDVRDALAEGEPPSALIKRHKEKGPVKTFGQEEWQILQERVSGQRPPKIAIDRGKGNGFVRVPLFAYRTTEISTEVLLRLGLQLGIVIRECFPADRKVEQIVAVASHVFFREDDEEGYQVWIGFAVCMTK